MQCLCIMGNSEIVHQEQQLSFYMEVEDGSLGVCGVYTSTKFTNCFIVKMIRELNNASQLELFSRIEDQQNIYLLSLYGYKFGKNCTCSRSTSTVVQTVTEFWEYLPTHLLSMIQHHALHSMHFQESELWHIIKACSTGYDAFVKTHTSFEYRPSKLMITRQGRLRLNWMHVKDKNIHTALYRKIKQKSFQLKEEEFFAPEELEAIAHQEFTHKINPECTNVFTLGMTLLYCASLKNPRIFYHQLQVMYPSINQALHSTRNIYSPELLHLIGWMLNPCPSHRPTFPAILQQYQSFMSPHQQIRIINPLDDIRKMSVSRKKLDPEYLVGHGSKQQEYMHSNPEHREQK